MAPMGNVPCKMVCGFSVNSMFYNHLTLITESPNNVKASVPLRIHSTKVTVLHTMCVSLNISGNRVKV